MTLLCGALFTNAMNTRCPTLDRVNAFTKEYDNRIRGEGNKDYRERRKSIDEKAKHHFLQSEGMTFSVLVHRLMSRLVKRGRLEVEGDLDKVLAWHFKVLWRQGYTFNPAEKELITECVREALSVLC